MSHNHRNVQTTPWERMRAFRHAEQVNKSDPLKIQIAPLGTIREGIPPNTSAATAAAYHTTHNHKKPTPKMCYIFWTFRVAHFVARVGVAVALFGWRRVGPGPRGHPVLRHVRYRHVGSSHVVPESHEVLVEHYLEAAFGWRNRRDCWSGGGTSSGVV